VQPLSITPPKLALALLLAATFLRPHTASAAPSLGVGPPPLWVVAAEPIDDEKMSNGGASYLLVDRQVRVGTRREDSYHHFVLRILNEASLHSESQLNIDFDPTFETLTMHRVRWSGTERFSKARTARIPPRPAREQPRSAAERVFFEARRDTASPEAFLLRATLFVQDEVRYVAVEVGMSWRRATDAAPVFSPRFGDCKDKTALLVALLRAYGMTARPALVRPRWGRAIVRSPLDDHRTYRIPGISHPPVPDPGAEIPVLSVASMASWRSGPH
jgi:transglutaminase-like putative cysteine protease